MRWCAVAVALLTACSPPVVSSHDSETATEGGTIALPFDEQILDWRTAAYPSNKVALGDRVSVAVLARLATSPGELVAVHTERELIFLGTDAAVLRQSPAEAWVFESVAVGSATIRVEAGRKSTELQIEVTNPEVRSLLTTPVLGPNIGLGAVIEFTVAALDSAGATNVVTESAKFDLDGDAISIAKHGEKLRLQAKKTGNSRLKLSYASRSVALDLTVTEPTAAGYELGVPLLLPVGTILPVKPKRRLTDGSEAFVADYELVSTQPDILQVLGASVKARRTGEAALILTADGRTHRSNVIVTEATVTSIDVDVGSSALPIGLTRSMTATAVFSDGARADVSNIADWSSSDTSVFEIDGQEGLALLPGSVTATATWQNRSGSKTLTVIPATIDRITITPDPASIGVGTAGLQFAAVAHFSDDLTFQDITATAVWSIVDFVGSGAPPAISSGGADIGRITAAASIGTATVQATINNALGIPVTGSALLEVYDQITTITIESLTDLYPTDGSDILKAMGTDQAVKAVDQHGNNISNQIIWSLDYFTPPFSAAAYLDATAATPTSALVKTISLGKVRLKASLPDASVSGERTLEVTAPILAETDPITCESTPNLPKIQVSESLDLDCEIKLSDGSTLTSNVIDLAGSWQIEWSLDITSGAASTFAADGTFVSSTMAQTKFTPAADGYATLVATASNPDLPGASKTLNLELLVARDCNDAAVKFGGASNHTDNLFCWHLGAAGASCSTVCTPFGGPHEAGSFYGSDTNRCTALRSQVGFTPPAGTLDGTLNPSSSSGFGCAFIEKTVLGSTIHNLQFGTLPFNDGVGVPDVKRYCACQE